MRSVIAAADVILALTDDKIRIIPGHGPLASRADLQRYRDMLETANARLLALKNQGLSAEAVVAQAPLNDLEAGWGGGIFSADKWITIVYPAVY